jgi:hypothetical protein
MASMVLLALFQSDGTVHVDPDVKTMTFVTGAFALVL